MLVLALIPFFLSLVTARMPVQTSCAYLPQSVRLGAELAILKASVLSAETGFTWTP